MRKSLQTLLSAYVITALVASTPALRAADRLATVTVSSTASGQRDE